MILRGCLSVLTRSKIIQRSFGTLPPEVVIFPTEEMIVCWHPEQTFPYECSKPLPAPKLSPYSVLKIQEQDARKMFARKPTAEQLAKELAAITYTTKHRWFPRSRDKRAKKTVPDRPYL